MGHAEMADCLSSTFPLLYMFLNTSSVPLKWNLGEHNLLRVPFTVHTPQDLPVAPSQDSSSYSRHCVVTAKSTTSRLFPTQAPPASWRATHLLVRSQSEHRLWWFPISNMRLPEHKDISHSKNHLWVPLVVVAVGRVTPDIMFMMMEFLKDNVHSQEQSSI